MKRNDDHKYSGITSFEDFRREKEILILRSKIVDMKLSMAFLQIRHNFSPSNLLLSLAKEYVLPEVAKFLGVFSEKIKGEADS
jgi:hypothetical protein